MYSYMLGPSRGKFLAVFIQEWLEFEKIDNIREVEGADDNEVITIQIV